MSDWSPNIQEGERHAPALVKYMVDDIQFSQVPGEDSEAQGNEIML